MIKRIFNYFFLTLFSLILVFLIIVFTPALWRHWVTYPRLEKQVSEFQKLRKETPELTTLRTYRGVMHVHSYLSHDSEGTIYDLTTAAKTDGISFIFLTDHPRYDLDTIPKGYHGNYDGVLIESGSEKQGFDCWPLDSTVINWKINKDTVARTGWQTADYFLCTHRRAAQLGESVLSGHGDLQLSHRHQRRIAFPEHHQFCGERKKVQAVGLARNV